MDEGERDGFDRFDTSSCASTVLTVSAAWVQARLSVLGRTKLMLNYFQGSHCRKECEA